MTRFPFTATAPICTRKDGEIGFADIVVGGRKIRIQTQARNPDRPVFTVDGEEIVAHNAAAVALIEGRDEAAAHKERIMAALRASDAEALRAEMTAIMATDAVGAEALARAEIVRANAHRIAAERITDKVVAAYVRDGDEAASIALGFGGLITTADEAVAVEAAYRAVAGGYLPRPALTDEMAARADAEREIYARDALPIIERARASWCALTGREMSLVHVNPITSLIAETADRECGDALAAAGWQ